MRGFPSYSTDDQPVAYLEILHLRENPDGLLLRVVPHDA